MSKERMRKRCGLHAGTVTLGLFLALAFAGTMSARAAAAATKPNFVVILIDDMGYTRRRRLRLERHSHAAHRLAGAPRSPLHQCLFEPVPFAPRHARRC